jgi:hypothetical protein
MEEISNQPAMAVGYLSICQGGSTPPATNKLRGMKEVLYKMNAPMSLFTEECCTLHHISSTLHCI